MIPDRLLGLELICLTLILPLRKNLCELLVCLPFLNPLSSQSLQFVFSRPPLLRRLAFVSYRQHRYPAGQRFLAERRLGAHVGVIGDVPGSRVQLRKSLLGQLRPVVFSKTLFVDLYLRVVGSIDELGEVSRVRVG